MFYEEVNRYSWDHSNNKYAYYKPSKAVFIKMLRSIK